MFGKNTFIGLAITFFAGVCFSLFSPAFNLATNDQWHTLKEGVPKLVVYTAFFYFSISCFVIALILNIIFLYHPVLDLPRSSFKAYLNDWNGRGWAFLGGFLCGFGNGLQFMEIKLQDMQQQMLFRSVLLHIQISICIHNVSIQ